MYISLDISALLLRKVNEAVDNNTNNNNDAFNTKTFQFHLVLM